MELPELEGRVQLNGSEIDVTAMVAEAAMMVSHSQDQGGKGLEFQKSAYLQGRNKAIGLKAVGGWGENEEKSEERPNRQPYIFKAFPLKPL